MTEPRSLQVNDEDWLLTDGDPARPYELVRVETACGKWGFVDEDFELHLTDATPLVVIEALLDRAREGCPECHSRDVTVTEQIFSDEIVDPVTDELTTLEYVAPAHICNRCEFGWAAEAREHEQTEAMFRFYGRRLRETAAALERVRAGLREGS